VTTRFAQRLLAVAIWLIAGSEAAAFAPCDDLAAAKPSAPAVARSLTAADLIELRDIGFSGQGSGALSVSPGGDRVAFQLRRAVTATNSYCLSIYVLDLRRGKPLVVDSGGELIRDVINPRGVRAFPTGIPSTIIPKWSPDGAWIAFLKRAAGGGVQVWRARADGGFSEAVTKSATDVADFEWSVAGRDIIYVTSSAPTADQDESLRGYLYDERFLPNASNKPFSLSAAAPTYFATDILSKRTRPATASEAELLAGDKAGSSLQATAPDGRRAWAQAAAATPALTELWAEGLDRKAVRCPSSCSNVSAVWWAAGGTQVFFTARLGWANSETTIYRWTPGDAPHRILSTADAITDCKPAAIGLVCLQAGSTQPRRIVAVGPSDGLRALYDPNPNFAALKLGRVERLNWKNAYGLEAFGDLVLPPDHRPGQHHPLIVVQYRTRGFLRGGTGDEYPIHLFAEQGYAVLSFDRPPSIRRPRGGAASDLNGLRQDVWADRRSVESALQTGIDLVLSKGVVDPTRIGITGLSDGASTVQFSLINGNRYAAAALSSCCEDPSTLFLAGGLYRRDRLANGWPSSTPADEKLWKPFALSRNAEAIRTPVLMQLADEEYLIGLETFEAFRALRRPAEMYVFPDEHHIKWQPAHRAEIYRRNIAWFNFWLLGKEDSVFGRPEEYARWRKLRVEAR
jgi:dipeptidyl aminopeptidase/acylaminoacyl peptidase